MKVRVYEISPDVAERLADPKYADSVKQLDDVYSSGDSDAQSAEHIFTGTLATLPDPGEILLLKGKQDDYVKYITIMRIFEGDGNVALLYVVDINKVIADEQPYSQN